MTAMQSSPSPLHQHSAEQAYLDSLFDTTASTVESPPPAGHADTALASGYVAIEQQSHTHTTPTHEKAAADTVTPSSTIIAQAQTGNAFDCRLISVAGLKLAVPEVAIAQVLPCPAGFGEAANTTMLVAGRFNHGAAAITVVNLRAVVLPDAVHADTAQSDSVIVLLQDGCTGLFCDAILEQVTVQPDRLCWRSATSRRIWLAATARADGFALLNPDGIIDLLTQALSKTGNETDQEKFHDR